MDKQYTIGFEKNPLILEDAVDEKTRHNMDSTDFFKDILVSNLRRGSDQLKN